MLIRLCDKALSIETVAGLPLILHTLLPFALSVLCKINIPSSQSKPSSVSFSSADFPMLSNCALTKADFSPVRMISREVRCPMMALIASMIILLPAPVSPVRTFSPELKSIEVFSITAMFSIYKVCSIISSLLLMDLL